MIRRNIIGTYTLYTLENNAKIKNIPMDVKNIGHVAELFEYGQVHEKWYDHRDDLLKISKANPDTLIIVECSSEDDEYWKLWFYNGVMREVNGIVVYPEIDLEELYNCK